MATCTPTPEDRRRAFWTWKSDACGYAEDECGNECGIPGLAFNERPCDQGCRVQPCNHRPHLRSIRTDGYIASLILGTLLTRGRRPDNACGWRPGERLGHWSDTFRTDGNRTGSRLFNGPPRTMRTTETLAWFKAAITADLAFLTRDGLVTSLKVDVANAGGGIISLTISWTEPAGSGVVGVLGGRVGQTWFWNGVNT